MTILCLIIANPVGTRVVYDDLRRQWLRYMNLYSDIKAYFILFDKNLNCKYKIDNESNSILLKGNESYTPGIYEKTILAMHACLSSLEFSDVDYVIRTNISAFWIWNRLLRFLKDKPRENYVSTGFIMDKCNTLCPHGSNMILSRDVAIKFTDNFNIPDKERIPDDILLGMLCKKYNITIHIYKWLVTTHIIAPNDYTETIENIDKDVFMIRNNLLDPKMRDLYEGKKYKMLVDRFY
jgi:hypothetical protein